MLSIKLTDGDLSVVLTKLDKLNGSKSSITQIVGETNQKLSRQFYNRPPASKQQYGTEYPKPQTSLTSYLCGNIREHGRSSQCFCDCSDTNDLSR